MDGTTRLVGIIGWPVAHSLSPAMHNAAFAALGLNWAYVPLPVPPGAVEDALRGLKALGFAGANVTIPHKEAVIPYLDEVTPAARAMGAVNTLLVRREDGTARLVGDNTDAIGFLEDLRAAGFDPAGRRCLVLGAGGGARAVVYALAQAGAQVTLHNRTPRRAQALVQALTPHLPGVSLTALPAGTRLTDLDLAAFDLLVNTTPVGMWPHPEASPWPEEAPLPPPLPVYDLVYRPAETRLLRQARRAGARAIGGLGMLLRQGAAAFILWTGEPAPLDVMRTALEAALREAPA